MQRLQDARFLLFCLLSTLATATGCGSGSAEKADSNLPVAQGPKATQPYAVRGSGSASRPGESPLRLATATEPVTEADSEPRSRGPAIERFEDWDMPETAAKALGGIGAAAVPELSRSLTDPNPLVRRRAADILARIGPEAQDAVPALIRTLDDRDEEVRKSAARALGEIGPAAKDAVPHLIEALREPGKIESGK